MENQINKSSEGNELETKKQELLDSSVHLFLTEYQKVMRGEKSKTILSALDYVPGFDMPKAKAILKRKPVGITTSRKEIHKLFKEILGLESSEGQTMIIKKEPPRETSNLRGYAISNPGKTLDVEQTTFYLKSSDEHFYLLTIDSYLEPSHSTLMAEIWEIRKVTNSHIGYNKKEEETKNETSAVIVYNPNQLPKKNT